MPRNRGGSARSLALSLVVFAMVGAICPLRAEHPSRSSGRTTVVNRNRPVYAVCPTPSTTLGTFVPTPYIVVRGNEPMGGGYSPLGIYGDQTMSLYGPFSPLRPAVAPVVTYTRGYNGEVRVTEGISSSYPNLPTLSPVIYPTEANHYYGPRVIRTPWWNSAINWIDQN